MFDIDIGPAIVDFFFAFLIYFCSYLITLFITLVLLKTIKKTQFKLSEYLLFIFLGIVGYIFLLTTGPLLVFAEIIFTRLIIFLTSISVIGVLLLFKLKLTSSNLRLRNISILLISFFVGIIGLFTYFEYPNWQRAKDEKTIRNLGQQMAQLYKIVSVDNQISTSKTVTIDILVPRDGKYAVSIFGFTPKNKSADSYTADLNFSIMNDINTHQLKKGSSSLTFQLRQNASISNINSLDIQFGITPINSELKYFYKINKYENVREGILYFSPKLFSCTQKDGVPCVVEPKLHIELKQ